MICLFVLTKMRFFIKCFFKISGTIGGHYRTQKVDPLPTQPFLLLADHLVQDRLQLLSDGRKLRIITVGVLEDFPHLVQQNPKALHLRIIFRRVPRVLQIPLQRTHLPAK